MPGPAPKDPASRRRRNAAVGKTILPAGGRVGDVPAWPIFEVDEPSVWASLWSLPQAAAWERDHMQMVLADYAILRARLYADDAPSASLLAEKRNQETVLGLNPKAMRSLLWEVADSDEVAEKRVTDQPSRTAAKRAQLKIVG